MEASAEYSVMVMLRPVYRWKSFWLGLFVACSLQWAWWDSLLHATAMEVFGVASHSVSIVRQKGESMVIWGPDIPIPSSGWWRFDRRDVPEVAWAHDVAEVIRVNIPDLRVRVIPDAAVFFPFLAMWCGWMVWRWKVERKRAVESMSMGEEIRAEG